MSMVQDTFKTKPFSKVIEDLIYQRLFVEVCDDFELPSADESTIKATCTDDEVLNKGLQTAVTYILEYIRAISANTDLNKSGPISIETGHYLLTDESYYRFEKYYLYVNQGLNQIDDKIVSEIKKYHSKALGYVLTLLQGINSQWVFGGLAIIFVKCSIFKKLALRKSVLLGILPTNLILDNENLKELMLKQ